MKKTKQETWTTRPISPTCEILRCYGACEKPTEYAYPAMGGGWMALCFKHGQKHLPHATHIEELIKRGETFS